MVVDKVKQLFVSKDFFTVVLVWLSVWLVGYLAYVFIPFDHEYMGFPYFRDSVVGAFGFLQSVQHIWDTRFFSIIAEQGYVQYYDHIGNLNFVFAFFPLFPVLFLLTRLVFGIFGVIFLPLFLIIGLMKTLYSWFDFVNINKKTIFWTLVMPFSLFIFLPYTEGLFVVLMSLSILLIYSSRTVKNNYLIVFIIGVLMMLTRSTSAWFGLGLFLIEFFNFFKYKENKEVFKKVFIFCSGLVIGLALWIIYNLIVTGSWNTFLRVQSYWGRSVDSFDLLSPFVRAINETFSGNISFSIIYLLLLCIVYFMVYKKLPFLPKEYKSIYWASLYMTVGVLLTSISQNTLQSLNRYAYATPLFIIILPTILTQSKFKYKKLAWFVLFGFLLFTSVLFFRHKWIG